MKIPHPIPYQGSKRNIADQIIRFFPNEINRLIEPFAGSGAISIASATFNKASYFILNDVNKPLIRLWEKIIYEPHELIEKYQFLWYDQLNQEKEYYNQVREKFNQTQQPEYLLYLLARCVKAAVRYNTNGDFNQGPDNRRKGRRPENMRQDILLLSNLMRGKVTFSSLDYQEVLSQAEPGDLIYMDPPYQGTGKNGGFRYYENLDCDNFLLALHRLNQKNVPYLISFDGRTGSKSFGPDLPSELELEKIEICAGRSSLATLHKRDDVTYESLYLSKCLLEQIDLDEILESAPEQQPTLFDLKLYSKR